MSSNSSLKNSLYILINDKIIDMCSDCIDIEIFFLTQETNFQYTPQTIVAIWVQEDTLTFSIFQGIRVCYNVKGFLQWKMENSTLISVMRENSCNVPIIMTHYLMEFALNIYSVYKTTNNYTSDRLQHHLL